MSGFTFEDIESLSVDLPEDIAKRKWHGDFKGADRLIGLWLKKVSLQYLHFPNRNT